MKKTTVVTLLTWIGLSHGVAFAQIKPVIGYVIEHRSQQAVASLTINGQKVLRVVSGFGTMGLEERMIYIARKCNELIDSGDFDPELLSVSRKGERYILKMGTEALFTLDEVSAASYRQPALLTMMQLANHFRHYTGAAPLTEIPRQVLAAKPTQVGYASWYGGHFIGRHTASGSRYNPRHLTAAHPELPFGTQILVTNLDSQKSVIVTVNDRGPFYGNRIIDLSPAAFTKIGALNSGIMKVRLDVLR